MCYYYGSFIFSILRISNLFSIHVFDSGETFDRILGILVIFCVVSLVLRPNIFLGKHRVYYRQERGNQIELLSEELSEKQYTLAGLVFALNNTLTFPGLTNSITVSPHTSAGTITLTMTGAASEEVRILTDDELRLLEVGNNWDISGTDWVYPRLISVSYTHLTLPTKA